MAVDYQQAKELLIMLYRKLTTSTNDGSQTAVAELHEAQNTYSVISEDVKKVLSDNKEALDIIFNSKTQSYLFVYTNSEPDETAHQTARNLFSQGYEINFANVTEMIVNNFLVLPAAARDIFTNKMRILLESREVPSTIKVKWNDAVKAILQI